MRAGGTRGPTVAALVLGLAACSGSAPGSERAPSGTTANRSIEEVQEAYTPEWMGLSGVVGTAIGRCDGEPCIRVFVAGPLEPLRERIPSEVEGYRVVLERSGPIRARDG